MITFRTSLWLGIWLLLVPFLGIPGIWKERLVMLTGLVVIGIALRAYYAKTAPAEKAQPETGASSSA
jgi:hypothetical protein